MLIGYDRCLFECYPLATTIPNICFAPLALSAWAASSMVAPVVYTSSTRKIRFPEIFSSFCTINTFSTFCILCDRFNSACGGVFFVLGIIFTLKKKEFRYIHYWLLAILVYFFIAAKEVEWHTYYTIPIIVPASIYIVYAISNSLELITAYKVTGIKKIALQALFVIMVVSLPLISYHKITGRYKAKRLEKDYPVQIAGKIVDETARKNDLVIGCIWGGPELLYYCNRRGWTMDANSCSIEQIEALKQEGAAYFATTKQDVIDGKVIEYLKSKYKTIKSTREYLIVKL